MSIDRIPYYIIFISIFVSLNDTYASISSEPVTVFTVKLVVGFFAQECWYQGHCPMTHETLQLQVNLGIGQLSASRAPACT